MMLGLLAAGCATGNVDPARPHAGAGYVDFYTEPAEELNWDVKEIAAGAQRGKTLFSELDPVEAGILRLALAPGRHELAHHLPQPARSRAGDSSSRCPGSHDHAGADHAQRCRHRPGHPEDTRSGPERGPAVWPGHPNQR